MRRFARALLGAAMGLLAASDAWAQSQAARPLVLEVLLVNDPEFPEVTPEAAAAILAQARATLADKLSFGGLEFRIQGSTTVQQFIQRNVSADPSCLEQFAPLRVRPGLRRARDIAHEPVDQFLSRWSVDSLRAFFPEAERAGLDGYAAIRDKLLLEFDRKQELIASFKLKSGRSLLAPDRVDERSYVSWICAVRNQDEADLILTNEFILYDLGSEPYPHSIFAKCKLGGASLLSPKRRAIHRRAVVSSTFSMVTDLPFFQEEGAAALAVAERQQVIGTFIVAHELGHAFFKIPDFYDHPPECLMTTKLATGYVTGFRELVAHPGPCPKCQPYVDAKQHVIAAEEARGAGKLEAAIASYKLAIQKTPKQVDGSYLRYIADLSQAVAEIYRTLGDDKEARRWVKAALRIVPDHTEAKSLNIALDGPPTTGEALPAVTPPQPLPPSATDP